MNVQVTVGKTTFEYSGFVELDSSTMIFTIYTEKGVISDAGTIGHLLPGGRVNLVERGGFVELCINLEQVGDLTIEIRARLEATIRSVAIKRATQIENLRILSEICEVASV